MSPDSGDDADDGGHGSMAAFKYGKTHDVTVAADSLHEVSDPTTGGTFVFPQGGHGVLQVREIIDGPEVTQGKDARRFFVTFSGPERVRLRLPVSDGSAVGLVGYGRAVGSVEGPSVDGWWYVPGEGAKNGEEQFDLPVPTAAVATQGLVTQALLAPSNPGYSQYGLFTYKPEEPKRVAIRKRVADAIDAYIGHVAESRQQALRTRVDDMAYSVYFDAEGSTPSYTGFMRFDRFIDLGITLRRCFFTLPLDVTDQSIYHEVGHFMAHAMVGDDVYNTLESQAQGADHGIGEANTSRIVGEEYAYYSQFMLGGSINGLNPYSSDAVSSVNPRDNDYTALEGFGTALLATLTRADSQAKAAASRRKEDVPILGATHADVLDVIAGGATTLPELRQLIDNMAAASYRAANKLPAMFERAGWSYHGKARLVDRDKQPLTGLKVDVVSVVGTTEYGMQASDQSVSDDDGVVLLPRLFPGTSLLRVVTADGRKGEVAVTPGWGEPTSSELDLGDVVVDLTLYCYAMVKTLTYKDGDPATGWSTCTANCLLYQGVTYDLFAGGISNDA